MQSACAMPPPFAFTVYKPLLSSLRVYINHRQRLSYGFHNYVQFFRIVRRFCRETTQKEPIFLFLQYKYFFKVYYYLTAEERLIKMERCMGGKSPAPKQMGSFNYFILYRYKSRQSYFEPLNYTSSLINLVTGVIICILHDVGLEALILSRRKAHVYQLLPIITLQQD